MRSVTVAFCSIVVLTCMPSQLSARDWQLELGGSWCAANWDNELDGWEETSSRGWGLILRGGYRALHGEATYARGSFDASTAPLGSPNYAYDADRDDLLLTLGWRLLENPGLVPCLVYGRTGSDTDITGFLYGGGPFAEDVTHDGYGIGMRVDWTFGGGQVAVGGQAAFLPWGRWKNTIHTRDFMYEEHVMHEEDDSPSASRAEVQVQYLIRPIGVMLTASYRVVREDIEFVDSTLQTKRAITQTWQGMELGASYAF